MMSQFSVSVDRLSFQRPALHLLVTRARLGTIARSGLKSNTTIVIIVRSLSSVSCSGSA